MSKQKPGEWEQFFCVCCGSRIVPPHNTPDRKGIPLFCIRCLYTQASYIDQSHQYEGFCNYCGERATIGFKEVKMITICRTEGVREVRRSYCEQIPTQRMG